MKGILFRLDGNQGGQGEGGVGKGRRGILQVRVYASFGRVWCLGRVFPSCVGRTIGVFTNADFWLGLTISVGEFELVIKRGNGRWL